MKRLIKNVESTPLFLADLEAEFDDRKVRLSQLGEEEQFDFIFGYHYDAIELALEDVKTNHKTILSNLLANLENLKESNDDQLSKLKELRNLLQKDGLVLKSDNNSVTPYSLRVDSFNDNDISCSLDSEYYSSTVDFTERTEAAPKLGTVFLGDIICSASAKAEYFPVGDD